jgi:succinyl-CoA synthetase alpha subunit
MGILIDADTSIVVQGITGREGKRRTELMSEYGTDVVAGVTPGRGDSTVQGVPVFDTVNAAMESVGGFDASVVFVPAPHVEDAAMEAIDAGVELVVLVPDHVPVHDSLRIMDAAADAGVDVIGPNSLGVCTVGEAILGMIGGTAGTLEEWVHPGGVGVVSRSGGMTSATAYYLAQRGLGISTMTHVGGDGIIGLHQANVVERLEVDDRTDVIVLIGEIGTSQEERVADLLERGHVTKPVVAYVGGAAADSGTRYSHAGAIVERGTGSQQHKVGRLREAGAHLADRFEQVPALVENVMEASDR